MKLVKLITLTVFAFALASLYGCSSHIPPEITQEIAGAPGVAEVRDNPSAFLSRSVRWGGVILKSENRKDTSWLTIIAFPLNGDGSPQVSDQSSGRFIAVVDGFLEPLLYATEREITVTGQLLETHTENIGEFPYEYPVVKVQTHYLWAEPTDYDDTDYPPYWWYDPWYHPYYPYYPYHPHRFDR